MTHSHDIAQAVSPPDAFSAPRVSLCVLTLPEAARELRCSRTQLYNILGGKFPGVPPLPVFHIGRRAFIRSAALRAWIRTLEAREREDRYASGFFGLRDNELEFIAGA
jgi:hypothetical protein